MGGSVSRMVELAEWYCGTANLGYDQWNRWDFPEPGDAVTPGECDCSSLVYHCAELAGFDVPKSGTRYTGTMKRDFTAAGFKWCIGSDWKAGDILYKDGHTAIWTGKYIAEAYGDEKGGSHGGKTGDQGQETRLSPRRGGWLGFFRFPEPEPDPPIKWPQEVEPMPAGEAIDYIIEEGSNNVAHKSDQAAYMVRWRKWASGMMEAWISDWYNGGTGTKYEGQWYLTKVLDMPDGFIEAPTVTLQGRASNGWISCQVHTITAKKVGFWAFGTKKSLPKFYLDAYCQGVWK